MLCEMLLKKRMININIKEIQAKSIITKSNLPDADYVINPYVGCSHACVYCYARFMRRFTGHKERWGQFIDVKINADKIFPKKTEKYRNKSIFLSSVTDPYNQLEKKYEITRKIIYKLIDLQPVLGIQTKSSLITRDIDLLKKIKNCSVGFTITSDSNDITRIFEPGASVFDDKIEALKQLHENGINTYIFIGPILPYITNWENIISVSKEYSNKFMFENANLHGTIWKDVKTTIYKYFNSLYSKYEKFYLKRAGYWEKEKKKIIKFCIENGLDYKIYFDHKTIRKK